MFVLHVEAYYIYILNVYVASWARRVITITLIRYSPVMRQFDCLFTKILSFVQRQQHSYKSNFPSWYTAVSFALTLIYSTNKIRVNITYIYFIDISRTMHDSWILIILTFFVITCLKIYKGIFTSDFRFNTVVLMVFYKLINYN